MNREDGEQNEQRQSWQFLPGAIHLQVTSFDWYRIQLKESLLAKAEYNNLRTIVGPASQQENKSTQEQLHTSSSGSNLIMRFASSCLLQPV